MQFDQLRRMALFVQVVRYGSFSAAARAQDLATSVLSAAVTQLEDDLGVRLLHRTTRSLSLTEVGQDYYQKCAEMLTAAETAHEMISEKSGEITGRLRIAAASDVAEKIVLPALTPLTRDHPKLTLDLRVADNILDMAEHQIDLSIRSGWLRDSSLVARKLADLHEILVASPAYLTRHGVPHAPHDLLPLQIIALTRLTDSTQLLLQNETGSNVKLELKTAAITDSVKISIEMAIHDFGLARLPSYAVDDEIRSGRLLQVLSDWKLPDAGIYAVTLKRNLQPQKVSAAIAALGQFMA